MDPMVRQARSTKMNITWIASYPKSGNTWMRFMLYAACYGLPKNSIDITRKIPDIHRQLPVDQPADGNLLAKTHLALTDKHPKLAQTRRAIHIIRHPKDILLSALNYRKMNETPNTQLSADQYANLFITNGGDPDWKRQGHSDWATHTRSWQTTTKFPVLLVRYESLKESPVDELTKILGFLEITAPKVPIEDIVKATSFDAMRAMEIREKNDKSKQDETRRLFVGSKHAASKGIYFMNTGKSGQSLDTIRPGLDEQFDNAFADALAEFGYAS